MTAIPDTPETVLAPYVVWTWRYYSLEADAYETLSTAIGVALATQEHGDGVLHCIEGPDGVVPQEEIDAAEEEREKQWRAEWKARPKNTHAIKVKAPNSDDWSWWSHHTSREDAEVTAAHLRERFGADRLHIHEFPQEH